MSPFPTTQILYKVCFPSTCRVKPYPSSLCWCYMHAGMCDVQSHLDTGSVLLSDLCPECSFCVRHTSPLHTYHSSNPSDHFQQASSSIKVINICLANHYIVEFNQMKGAKFHRCDLFGGRSELQGIFFYSPAS